MSFEKRTEKEKTLIGKASLSEIAEKAKQNALEAIREASQENSMTEPQSQLSESTQPTDQHLPVTCPPEASSKKTFPLLHFLDEN